MRSPRIWSMSKPPPVVADRLLVELLRALRQARALRRTMLQLRKRAMRLQAACKRFTGMARRTVAFALGASRTESISMLRIIAAACVVVCAPGFARRRAKSASPARSPPRPTAARSSARRSMYELELGDSAERKMCEKVLREERRARKCRVHVADAAAVRRHARSRHAHRLSARARRQRRARPIEPSALEKAQRSMQHDVDVRDLAVQRLLSC